PVYARPQDALRPVGTTGTKGKTPTAWLAGAALRAGGLEAAVLGTVVHDLGPAGRRGATNTTPGVLEIRRLLAQARDAGCRAAVLEVSSHALHQGRTAGLEFAAAVFTNLGHDHLDYHRDLDEYAEAKRRLFRGLDPASTAILNRDEAMWRRMAEGCRGRILTFGTDERADLCVHDLRLDRDHTDFVLGVQGTPEGRGAATVRTALVGRHNPLNLAAAVGAALSLGVDLERAAQGAAGVAQVPGRLERVLPGGDLSVFVDYAHTDGALRAVLGFLREVGATPLTCVVGCGGDRDRTKRPRMARTAATLCERVVLTSDNPRTEDPIRILEEMEAGLEANARRHVAVQVDRREAIREAILGAPSGGTVLVAGKGHETYQILDEERIPFDDVEEVREALRLRRAVGSAIAAPPASNTP
ncbi:MAG: UDP-N-acetylmuramoyl-L-alanyl-D-glutamate--2,6-diaminopimelate ligase, partial [Planctomycetota bacterium]